MTSVRENQGESGNFKVPFSNQGKSGKMDLFGENQGIYYESGKKSGKFVVVLFELNFVIFIKKFRSRLRRSHTLNEEVVFLGLRRPGFNNF